MSKDRVSKAHLGAVNNASFAFVLESPGTGNDSNRRQIKSHVTRWQHRQARSRKRREEAESELSLSGRDSTPTRPVKAHRITEFDRTSSSSTSDSTSEVLGDGCELVQHSTPDARTIQPGIEDNAIEHVVNPFSAAAQAFSRGEMSYRTIALRDAENIMGTNLDALELDLSTVMSLYKSMSKMQSADFRRQYGLQGTLAEARFYAFVHTDPTLLSVAVLISIRNVLDLQGRRMQGRDLVAVVNLEQYLVSSINAALAESDRGTSNQMLAAVALCAAYELKHGDPRRFHVHMQGLVRMIGLRGGMEAVGRFDLYIARFLIWMDVNTSKLSGSECYLQDMSGVSEICGRPTANMGMFRARSDEELARVRGMRGQEC